MFWSIIKHYVFFSHSSSSISLITAVEFNHWPVRATDSIILTQCKEESSHSPKLFHKVSLKLNRAEDVKIKVLYDQLRDQTFTSWCVACSPCTLTVMFTTVCWPAVLLTTQRYSPASSRRILVVLRTMEPINILTCSPSPPTCLASKRRSPIGSKRPSPPEGRQW